MEQNKYLHRKFVYEGTNGTPNRSTYRFPLIRYFDELRRNTFKETAFDKEEGLKPIWATVETVYIWNEKVRSWVFPKKKEK